LPENHSDRCPHADLPPVAALSENAVEVQDTAQRNAQSRPNLPTIIPQSESDLQDLLGLQQLGNDRPAFWPAMRLKQERSIPKGKLDDVRALALFPRSKCWFRFGIESDDAGRNNLTGRLLDRLHDLGDVDAIQCQTLKRL
jgi:hypothetical protein